MNDDLAVGHIIAGKIAAAVWSDPSFKRPIKEVKLLEEDTPDERNNKVYKTLKLKGLI